MQHKDGTCLQTIKQWWYETHILSCELSKFMIPRTCSLHTLKTIWGPSLITQGQENDPVQPGRGTNDGSVTSTQERQRRSFPPPHFSFDYEIVVHKILGHDISHPPSCKSHRRPILINHFLFTSLLWLNSSLQWANKGLWYQSSLEFPWNDISWFQFVCFVMFYHLVL